MQESQEAESGRGERDVLHLEGKRTRDVERDVEDRAELKRKTVEAAASDVTKKRKAESKKKRENVLIEFSSVAKVAQLCSGQEKCCSKKCLEVNTFSLRVVD